MGAGEDGLFARAAAAMKVARETPSSSSYGTGGGPPDLIASRKASREDLWSLSLVDQLERAEIVQNRNAPAAEELQPFLAESLIAVRQVAHRSN